MPTRRIDVITQDVDNQSVSTEKLGNERHYAGAYDGADADARLDSAISQASAGDTIFLENSTYSDDRTIAKSGLQLVGTGLADGTFIDANWTLDNARVRLFSVGTNSNTLLTLSSNQTAVIDTVLGFDTDIDVNADQCVLSNVRGDKSNLTFQSGTADCIADTLIKITVTDNGSNTVGDIA